MAMRLRLGAEAKNCFQVKLFSESRAIAALISSNSVNQGGVGIFLAMILDENFESFVGAARATSQRGDSGLKCI